MAGCAATLLHDAVMNPADGLFSCLIFNMHFKKKICFTLGNDVKIFLTEKLRKDS